MKYIAIYDLRILPLALGDMVSWVAYHRLTTLIQGIEKFDVAIIFPDNFCGNLLNEVRTRAYWAKHLDELSSIFLSEEAIESCIILDDLEKIPNKHQYGNIVFEVQLISEILQNLRNVEKLWDYIRKFQRYDVFNKYFIKTGSKLILSSKKNTINEVDAILENYEWHSNLIVCQPRFRMIDTGLPLSDPRRDSDFIAWHDFFESTAKLYPKIKFILIGRVESIPIELCGFGNVVLARNLGLNLGHEIALIRSQRLFLGASSGFAVVANFSNSPYTILTVKLAGFENFGINTIDTKLIFSSNQQFVTQDEISLEVLHKHIQKNVHGIIFDELIPTNLNVEDGNKLKKYSEFDYIFRLMNNRLDDATKIYSEKNLFILIGIVKKINLVWKNNHSFTKFRFLNSNIIFFYLKYKIKFFRVKIRFFEYYEVIRKYKKQKLLLYFISDRIQKRLSV
jgi:hypothetical protein